MHWIADHSAFVQAISSVVIAVFTIILIILTAVYATANWRTMRLLEGDLRSRTQPIPSVHVRYIPTQQFKRYKVLAEVRTRHAPIKIRDIQLKVIVGEAESNPDVFDADFVFGDPQMIAPGESYRFDGDLECDEYPKKWAGTLIYSDIGDVFQYIYRFNQEGFSDTRVSSESAVRDAIVAAARWLKSKADQPGE